MSRTVSCSSNGAQYTFTLTHTHEIVLTAHTVFLRGRRFLMEETARCQNFRGDPADCLFCFFRRFFPVCCLPPAQACAIISSQFCIQLYAASLPPRAILQIFCFFLIYCNASSSLIIPPETDLKLPHDGRD